MGTGFGLAEHDVAMAPCVEQGPLAAAASEAIIASRALGVSPWASMARASAVPFLFEGMEQIFASGLPPAGAVAQRLMDLAELFRAASRVGLASIGGGADDEAAAAEQREVAGEVAHVTGDHYGRLFNQFSSRSYWDEPARLLSARLQRNGVDLGALDTATVLDAGCGGGRYTAAWKLLGAQRAVGVDISSVGIADARARVAAATLDGVDFEEGSVLDLPFPSDTFEIVFSNGVLHHTEDWRTGVFELLRVLKPGGLGWLYLIERPGGLFWDVIEVLRVIMSGERRDAARAALTLLRIPANRIFYMLDHVMVPINVRLAPEEIEAALREADAVDIRRLTRGADFDRVEQIWRQEPFAEIKYGVGENRYVFRKPR